jgi:hypothetical protein
VSRDGSRDMLASTTTGPAALLRFERWRHACARGKTRVRGAQRHPAPERPPARAVSLLQTAHLLVATEAPRTRVRPQSASGQGAGRSLAKRPSGGVRRSLFACGLGLVWLGPTRAAVPRCAHGLGTGVRGTAPRRPRHGSPAFEHERRTVARAAFLKRALGRERVMRIGLVPHGIIRRPGGRSSPAPAARSRLPQLGDVD